MESVRIWLSDQMNLTTVIAVLSLAVSAFTLATSLLSKRRNLDIKIFAYCPVKNSITLSMSFENRSQLPIAITNLKLCQNGVGINCAAIPKLVGNIESRTNGKVDTSKDFFSDKLPIQIASLGAVSCLVYFGHLPETPEAAPTSLTFEVCTNRGRAFQRTLPLSEEVLSRRTPF